MAKLTFHLPNGEQLAFRLFTDRRLRIGRERGNDIVLRDARVSRTHAEVSFERGFFVVRDLGSSNGTFVNGREIQVAPLTEGAELRIGSSVGRFSEELSDAPPTGPGAGRGRPREDEREPDPVTEAPSLPEPYDDQPGHTKKHPKTQDPKWDYHREQEAMSERPTDELPDPVPPSREPERAVVATPQELAIRWTVERSDTGRSVLSGTGDERAYFNAPWDAVGLLSSFTAIAMLIAGFGASIAFVGRGTYGAAALSVGLTLIFVFAVMQLVPRQDIDLYEDESMSRLWIALRQETRGSFPTLRYSAREANGSPFAHFRKSFWTNLGTRRWQILDRNDVEPVAEVREEASPRAWARKLIGAVTAGLVTNFFVRSGDEMIGNVVRHAGAIYRSIVEIRPAPGLDSRSVAALAVLMEVVERK